MKRTKSKSVYRKFVLLVRQAAYFCDCVWPCILIETLKTPLQGYNKLCMNINPHFIGSNCIHLKVCLCMPLHTCELVPVNRHSICVSMCVCMHACGFHHTWPTVPTYHCNLCIGISYDSISFTLHVQALSTVISISLSDSHPHHHRDAQMNQTDRHYPSLWPKFIH